MLKLSLEKDGSGKISGKSSGFFGIGGTIVFEVYKKSTIFILSTQENLQLHYAKIYKFKRTDPLN
jgi:hypothetical protein